jgi:hypothetical protein
MNSNFLALTVEKCKKSANNENFTPKNKLHPSETLP